MRQAVITCGDCELLVNQENRKGYCAYYEIDMETDARRCEMRYYLMQVDIEAALAKWRTKENADNR